MGEMPSLKRAQTVDENARKETVLRTATLIQASGPAAESAGPDAHADGQKLLSLTLRPD
jgi:hypothetical protein